MKYFIFHKRQLLVLFIVAIALQPAKAQLLKKLKDKVNQTVDQTVNKKVGDATGVPASGEGNTQNNGNNNGKPSNTKGGGLSNSTPPDVLQQMADAEKAHTAGSLSEARYSIQQALVGVEIQLGRAVLKSLPATVEGMAKDTTKNVVSSTQWGWNNLTIQTVYSQQPDKQMTVTIGNNALYAGVANMYFNNYAMVQANEKDQNIKQTRIKGYKAIIEYDNSKGYTLMAPLGQSSLIVWECVNFATEEEVMKAANAFDIDGIKKMMGEQ